MNDSLGDLTKWEPTRCPRCVARLEERIAALVAALKAYEHFKAARAEYYDQKDLGKPPSKGWGKLGFIDVTHAESEADQLRKAALSDTGEGWLPPKVLEEK